MVAALEVYPPPKVSFVPHTDDYHLAEAYQAALSPKE